MNIFKSGIGQGADLLTHAPEGLPDSITFDYSLFLAGDLIRQKDLYLPVDMKWQIRYMGGPGKMVNPGWFRWSMWVWIPGFGAKPLAFGADEPSYYAGVDYWDTERIATDLQTWISNPLNTYPSYRWWIRPDDPTKVTDIVFDEPNCLWRYGMISPHDESPEAFLLAYDSDPLSVGYRVDPDYSILPHPRYCVSWPETPLYQQLDYPVPYILRDKYANIQLYFLQALIDWLNIPQGLRGLGSYSRREVATFEALPVDPDVSGSVQYSEEWCFPGQADRYSNLAKEYYRDTYPRPPQVMMPVDVSLARISGWRVITLSGRDVLALTPPQDPEISDPQGFSLNFRLNFDDVFAPVIDHTIRVIVNLTPAIETYRAWTIEAILHNRVTGANTTQVLLLEESSPGVTTWEFDNVEEIDRIDIFFEVDLSKMMMVYDYDDAYIDLPRFYDVAGHYDGVIGDDVWIESIEMVSVDTQNNLVIDPSDCRIIPVAEFGDALYDEWCTDPKPDYDHIKLMWTDGVLTPPAGVTDVWSIAGWPDRMLMDGAPGFTWSSDLDATEIISVSHKYNATITGSVVAHNEIKLVAYMSSLAEIVGPYFDEGGDPYVVAFPRIDPAQWWPADRMDESLWYHGPVINSSYWIDRDIVGSVETGIDRRFIHPEQLVKLVLHPTDGAIARDGELLTGDPYYLLALDPVAIPPGHLINLLENFPVAPDGTALREFYSLPPYPAQTPDNWYAAWIQFSESNFGVTFYAASAYHKLCYVSEPWMSPDILTVRGVMVERDDLYVSDFYLRDLETDKLIDVGPPPTWNSDVISVVGGVYYLRGGISTGPPEFQITAAPGYVNPLDPTDGQEGLTNLRWEVADSSPFVDSYVIQELTPCPV